MIEREKFQNKIIFSVSTTSVQVCVCGDNPSVPPPAAQPGSRRGDTLPALIACVFAHRCVGVSVCASLRVSVRHFITVISRCVTPQSCVCVCVPDNMAGPLMRLFTQPACHNNGALSARAPVPAAPDISSTLHTKTTSAPQRGAAGGVGGGGESRLW